MSGGSCGGDDDDDYTVSAFNETLNDEIISSAEL